MAIKISGIEGNRQWLDGGSMFGNAPRPLWQRWASPDELGRIPLACRSLLLEVESKKILCETGIGAFFEPGLAQRYGVENADQHLLIENLKALGIEHQEIDYVILSHLHFDHAGGLLPTYEQMQKSDWQLLFPNAKYIVGLDAWERAQNPHFRDKASFVPPMVEKLQKCDRLIVIKNCEVPNELSPWLSFFESNGHTPGQLHTVIHGSESDVVFCGDLIPGVPWANLPITMGYDRFPEKLIEEKGELYKRMEGKKWQAFFTHDPKVALSRIAKNEKGKFAAVDTHEKLQRRSI